MKPLSFVICFVLFSFMVLKDKLLCLEELEEDNLITKFLVTTTLSSAPYTSLFLSASLCSDRSGKSAADLQKHAVHSLHGTLVAECFGAAISSAEQCCYQPSHSNPAVSPVCWVRTEPAGQSQACPLDAWGLEKIFRLDNNDEKRTDRVKVSISSNYIFPMPESHMPAALSVRTFRDEENVLHPCRPIW